MPGEHDVGGQVVLRAGCWPIERGRVWQMDERSRLPSGVCEEVRGGEKQVRWSICGREDEDGRGEKAVSSRSLELVELTSARPD